MSVKTMENPKTKGTVKPGTLKFILGSLLGAFLFLIPIPTGDGAFNIPLGIIINWVNGVTVLENIDLRVYFAYGIIIASFVGTVIAWAFKPAFIMNNPKVKEVLLSNPLYSVTRLIALVLFTMVIFDFGPTVIIDRWEGAGLMVFDFLASLMTIFLVLGFAIPVLTDFGLMEFVGVLIRKFVKKLFTLPGRASIDLAASWFGSSIAGVVITKEQHEKGYYTGREAAIICSNFALVSVPFSLIVAGTLGLETHFALWYLTISVVCIILGMIMPRIWPFKSIKNDYLEGVDVQINENVDPSKSLFTQAVDLASTQADTVKAGDVVKSGLNTWLSLFLDVAPVIIAWGTIALVIDATTPIIDWISTPMGWFLELLQVPGGAAYANHTVIGFVDMFLPAIFMGSETYFNTRFIIGALSIVQVIYLAETGAMILKSKIPLGLGKLIAIFFLRTIIGLPLIVAITWLLTAVGLL